MGFELTRYTNAWGNAGVTVTVLRGNDWALGPITVDYATSDLTAKAGQDYQAVSGTLEFQENETVKSLTIPILRARPTGANQELPCDPEQSDRRSHAGDIGHDCQYRGGLSHGGASVRYCADYPPRFGA